MHSIRSLWISLFVVALWIVGPVARAQMVDGKRVVEASLISSVRGVVPGQSFEVGLLLKMAPGWHTYWENSGDAGLPTALTWRLPEGFEAGAMQWPLPERKIEPGEIWTYGYSDQVLLIINITPPKVLSGDKVVLSAKADWLVCKEICVPGSAELSLTLPVVQVTSPDHTDLFAKAKSAQPRASGAPFVMRWEKKGSGWELEVEGVDHSLRTDLFPLPAEGQESIHPTSSGQGRWQISGVESFRGVLVIGEGSGRQGWMIQSPSASAGGGWPAGLWLALFNGFLGGLILNLMPCVLPVISLKVFGFMRQAGESAGKIFVHGLAFSAGIFAWFGGLAIVILALRAGGSEVAWSFQFQNPWFNIVVGSILFVFALNLMGLFEVVLPGRASHALGEASSGSGLGGSFFQGVFATLLATPCTAPFLGAALGFAFAQSAGVILLMFGAVATGMSLPYLILTARPSWMRFLPRPGAWMEKVKQLMAFPLLASLVWIGSILGAQQGIEGLVWFLAFLLCLGLACWIYGNFCGPISSPRVRGLALVCVATVVIGGGWFCLWEPAHQAAQSDDQKIVWTPFAPAQIIEAQRQGRAVFVDFTADWCITCKFNERTAIQTSRVRALLKSKNILPMKADWTSADPVITSALKSFGRVGVPLYVLYPANGAEPIVLPELLTESLLLGALAKLP